MAAHGTCYQYDLDCRCKKCVTAHRANRAQSLYRYTHAAQAARSDEFMSRFDHLGTTVAAIDADLHLRVEGEWR